MLSSKQIQIVITAAVLILAVVMPVETFHLLMEIVVEIYELLEFTLDEVIHHVFETSRHTTQVIVFYLMLGMFLYGLYRLARLLRAINLKVKTVISGWHAICNERSANAWKPWLLDKRVRMLCGFTFGGACLALLVF
ncbi:MULTISPECIES: hypothetical protein [unclassified Methylobacter]|uniref:hypothetical protein n=1 Tax=unclassified Methylobacter TaxID=2635283 RepID=UPI0018940B0C|nr:hypothetical protein [Methylobacter sp. BlB1]MBF6650831.1 hypothetical protein [Methylobacter sp. BlB1]